MVPIAGGRVRSDAVEVGIGNRHSVRGARSQDEMLAANARGRDMINPDHVRVVEGDCVSAPDVLGVEVCDCNVSGTG